MGRLLSLDFHPAAVGGRGGRDGAVRAVERAPSDERMGFIPVVCKQATVV
jgi:hypothetical protein